jgi:hypothetical protein
MSMIPGGAPLAIKRLPGFRSRVESNDQNLWMVLVGVT